MVAGSVAVCQDIIPLPDLWWASVTVLAVPCGPSLAISLSMDGHNFTLVGVGGLIWSGSRSLASIFRHFHIRIIGHQMVRRVLVSEGTALLCPKDAVAHGNLPASEHLGSLRQVP